MQWYANTVQSLEYGKIYSRSALLNQLKENNPSLSDNSFQWTIGKMVKSGRLIRVDHDKYVLAGENILPVYFPAYSDKALKLMEKISKQFPYVRFTVFETVLMNEFLNHLIAQNTIFFQVEKEASVFVFRFLQEEGYQSVMYKPTKKELSFYWTKDCIIVTDMISEAPLRSDSPHSICIEKLLVDMYCDKLISDTYSKAEYESVTEQVLSRYRVETTKLLRYARRRNKEAGLAKIINKSLLGEG
ncbi:MAG: hypothetical protein J6M57_00200 [Acidaminococcaceae bacterium]|nr:hypothetical protein [Acidaminococcaceae bacterium]